MQLLSLTMPHIFYSWHLNTSTTASWWFNNLLLTDKEFVNFILDQLEQFISTNDKGEVSKGTLWESLKAYIWGQVISYAKSAHRSRLKRRSEISDEILKVDHQHSVTPSIALYNKRISLQSDFDFLSTEESGKLLLQSRYRWYEQGEKAGCLLAHQIRQTATARLIA